MLRAFVLIAGLTATFIAWAQRPPAVVPADPHIVLEHLPHGYARLMPTSISPISAAAPAVSITRIQQLLTTAAQTGDARLAARADALLARMPAQAKDPDVLLARAFSAQHRHDFAAAVALLDTVIAQSPRNAAARLSRAQVQLVRGRLDLARADCTALVLGIDAGSGLLCVGMVSLRSGHYTAAAAALDRWLQDSSPADEGRRYALVMRAEVAARAGDRDADAWFRRASVLAPDDVRTLAAYARYLRGLGRDREVAALLVTQSSHDGLQLQRTLAAYRLDPRTAAPLVAIQARRFAAAHAAGSPVELRDEAEFLLVARNDAPAALTLAQANFRTQRDYEDVTLLQRAAMAAQRTDALQSLQAWAVTQHLSLPPTPEVAR
ncbi:MAG TPA: tetratricopeptide repeat protein [Lysobacter sp.]|nr:tetratricopeptide repeat protein [Lysobacter sp.]